MSRYVSIPLAEVELVRDALSNARMYHFANLLNEAISAELDAPDYQAMVAQLVECIGLYTLAGFVATADERGTKLALAALESAAPCVAKPVDDRKAWLALMREAVKAEGLTVHATLYSRADPATGARTVIEHHALLPVLAVPRLGEVVLMPSGRSGRVFRAPRHVGRSAVIELAAIAPPQTETGEDLQAQEADPR